MTTTTTTKEKRKRGRKEGRRKKKGRKGLILRDEAEAEGTHLPTGKVRAGALGGQAPLQYQKVGPTLTGSSGCPRAGAKPPLVPSTPPGCPQHPTFNQPWHIS